MMDTSTLQSALSEYFAPWVQDLHLQVERFDAEGVTLRLPRSARLSRVGGMLCGQAMMASADTAMVLALINHFGEFKPCTTVQMNSSFLKPLSGQDALLHVRVIRAGKSLALKSTAQSSKQDQSVIRGTPDGHARRIRRSNSARRWCRGCRADGSHRAAGGRWRAHVSSGVHRGLHGLKEWAELPQPRKKNRAGCPRGFFSSDCCSAGVRASL
jgi:acyl-coenzyme A thioesterase PaaI-like protein